VGKGDDEHRRVYRLSEELLTRVKRFQTKSGFKYEVDAVRRLLDEALRLRDTAGDILDRLDARFQRERNLRTLAQQHLAGHPLVINLEIDDHQVIFTLRNGEHGSISSSGELGHADQDDHDALSYYKRPAALPSAKKG
jgi:hypothetical protein